MKRAQWKAHSSQLEGHALLLCARRVVRDAAKHSKKAAIILGRCKMHPRCCGEGSDVGQRIAKHLQGIGGHGFSSELASEVVLYPFRLESG